MVNGGPHELQLAVGANGLSLRVCRTCAACSQVSCAHTCMSLTKSMTDFSSISGQPSLPIEHLQEPKVRHSSKVRPQKEKQAAVKKQPIKKLPKSKV